MIKTFWIWLLVPVAAVTCFLGARYSFASPDPSAVSLVSNKTDPKITIEVFFVPGDDAQARILNAIKNTKHEILVQSFLFTDKKIANELIKAHYDRKIDVEVINDKTAYKKIKQAPVLPSLVKAGIPVYLDGKHSTAHNKIMVIDGHDPRPVIITGSYNFTIAAEKHNAENMLVFTGDHTLADAYRANWFKHKNHSSLLK